MNADLGSGVDFCLSLPRDVSTCYRTLVNGESMIVTITDQYFDARTMLDLAASYTFRNGVGLYFNVKNLTDAPWRIYEGTRNRVIQQEYYDFTYEFGPKFKF